MKLRTLALVLAALATVLTTGCGSFAEPDTRLTVQFSDATGLFHGNEVGVRGVKVGEVVKITPAGSHVDVEIVVDGGVDLPVDVGAVIVSRSVATDRYIELTPAYSSGPTLPSGAVIGPDRTRTPVEFEEMLGSLEDISSALSSPDGSDGPLHDLLASTAGTLEGHGTVIATGLSDLATVLTSLAGSAPVLEENLVNLDTLTQTLASNDALVRDFISQVTRGVSMLDQQKSQIEATFEAITAMLNGLSEVSVSHREALAEQIDDFVLLADELTAREAEITQLLQTAPLTTQNLPYAVDDRGRMRFLTRPVDLVPGQSTLNEVCHAVEQSCALTDGLSPLFVMLAGLRGEA